MSRNFTREAGRRTRPLLVLILTAVLLVPGTQVLHGTASAATETLSADTYKAAIRRTTNGVPHVLADNIGSVGFGQGYAYAEDRFCDLADQIVKVRSERSRWFGPGPDGMNLMTDFGYAALGLQERAKQQLDKLSAEERDLLNGYVRGFNAFLAATGASRVPGWCAGQPWIGPITAVDVLAYQRNIALLASGDALLAPIALAAPPGTATTTSQSLPIGANLVKQGMQRLIEQRVGQADLGSNAWALGRDRSTTGRGALIANPHFPWERELRFWESHLTVPGKLNVYGAGLGGLPGVQIGFTDKVAWSHTIAAGSRFTFYSVYLLPGSPTTYVVDGKPEAMTGKSVTVPVKQADGSLQPVTRTMWSSHYGPIIDVRAEMDIPQLGWTEETALTYRDANIDDDEILDQYLGMIQAGSLDELIEVHEANQGIPLFNTIATDKDGRAWYADTSATPNLSAEAIAAFEEKVETDVLTGAAVESGLVLLDGSDPLYEWVEEDGARDPGLVPFDRMPMVERDDYVFNANDSYWMPHATEMLEGDYSPLHGRPATPRTPRTRENAVVLDDMSAEGPSGADGRFDLDELAAAALKNEGFMARELQDAVVTLCSRTPSVDVPALPAQDGTVVLPAATISLTKACEVLAAWDGIYDLDRAGPVLFREMLSQYPSEALMDVGLLWDEPFDPERPLETPRGMQPQGPVEPDTAMINLARAVQVLELAGLPVDVKLGDVQVALRDGERIPVHGGSFVDGTTNVVGRGGLASASILDDEIPDIPGGTYAPGTGSQLGELDGEPAYGVANGTSFLLAVAFTDDGPRAKAFLTYGNTEDRSSDLYTEATQRFSDKEWREVLLDEAAIEDAATSTATVHG